MPDFARRRVLSSPEVSRGLNMHRRVGVHEQLTAGATRRIRTLDSGTLVLPCGPKASKRSGSQGPPFLLGGGRTPTRLEQTASARRSDVLSYLGRALSARGGDRTSTPQSVPVSGRLARNQPPARSPQPGPAPLPEAFDADLAVPGWTRSRRVRERSPRTGLLQALRSRGLRARRPLLEPGVVLKI